MVEKVYEQDPYAKEFKAKVMEIVGNAISLDRTIFFPEGGGQSGDSGYLGELKVIDTRYSPDKQDIYHIVDGDIPYRMGDSIEGRIDWDKRYATMKLHAASHIMEHFLFKLCPELKLLGSHVNEKNDSSTYLGEIPSEKADKLSELVNNFIAEDYEIKRWEDTKKKGWWYWEAGDIKLPCGGTHPRRTIEIGRVRIKIKGGGSGKRKVLTSLFDEKNASL